MIYPLMRLAVLLFLSAPVAIALRSMIEGKVIGLTAFCIGVTAAMIAEIYIEAVGKDRKK